MACENEVVTLQCNPNSRLVVFSASYGRTEYESIQCPQPQGVPEESKYIIIILLISNYITSYVKKFKFFLKSLAQKTYTRKKNILHKTTFYLLT